MSLTAELEQLQRKKAELKNQLQFIEGKERTLGASIKILEERLSVQELEERVKARRVVVDRLESKRMDLEKRLKEPQKRPAPSPMPQRPKPTPEVKEKVEEPQKRPAPMEVTVSAAPAENKQPKPSAPAASQQPKGPEDQKEKEKEKKKRRWF